MGKRLYVGNLPYDADEATLREAFGQDGRVVERVHVVMDRETQRPRGFAFIEMATDEQAKQAIASMDGTMFGTRQLRVTEAEERRPGGPGGPGGPRPDRGPSASAAPRAGGGGGPPRAFGGGGDDAARHRFGPDARPKHERAPERRAAPKRRSEDGDDDSRGNRGNRRFDDDDE